MKKHGILKLATMFLKANPEVELMKINRSIKNPRLQTAIFRDIRDGWIAVFNRRLLISELQKGDDFDTFRKRRQEEVLNVPSI